MPTIRPAGIAFLAGLALLLPGCGQQKVLAPSHDNERPTVTFSRAPSRSGDLYSYSYEMEWTGFDPDGELRGFMYAIDPPGPTTAVPAPDSAWVKTTDFGGTFEFKATVPQPPVPGTSQTSADYHVFVIKAIDDRGLTSAPLSVAFNASTIAPVARILTPVPSSRFRQYLPPSFNITWDGSDLDGIASQKPTYYRVKLITVSTPITPLLMATYPDTLIDYYQPRGWATWDSLGPGATGYSLSTLAPLQDYAFVVIAFDEAGAYTPYASGDVNVLNFRALFANAGGPKLTIYNDFFTYTYTNGVYAPNDARYEIALEVPAGVPLTFNWTAEAQDGTSIKYYRWVLDSENLDDSTPRTNERTDMSHWSVPTQNAKSAQVGSFFTAGDHRLYIEAGDANGLRSLGVVHFTVVVGTFDRPLAICDDTRLGLDRRSPGATTCIDHPLGRFPTAAELDTFLYARGGVPMKCYPTGMVSRRGLFYGYDYDTLNMRPGKANLTPGLAVLARYRHLVWLVDPAAPDNSQSGSNLVDGMTTMRYMNSVGHLNVLAAYLRQGGEVWMAGGGSASASIVSFNSTTNDRPSRAYSAAAGELKPGRFLYDFVHWRSELRPASGVYQIRKNLGRLTGTTGIYDLFPAAVGPKSLAAGDSLPPWRTSGGDFYLSAFDLEALTLPNSIVEDFDPDPNAVDMQSTLDTVFTVSGGSFAPNSTIMTVYHGLENDRVITTGFDLWSYNKDQLKQVIDGVLQGIWGLARRAPPVAMNAPMPRAVSPPVATATRRRAP